MQGGDPTRPGRTVLGEFGNPEIHGTEDDFDVAQAGIRLRFTEKKIFPKFYAFLFKHRDYRSQLMGRGANIHNLSQDILREIRVPIPPLAEQRALVAELEAERALVEANRELAARFEKKLAQSVAAVWGEA